MLSVLFLTKVLKTTRERARFGGVKKGCNAKDQSFHNHALEVFKPLGVRWQRQAASLVSHPSFSYLLVLVMLLALSLFGEIYFWVTRMPPDQLQPYDPSLLLRYADDHTCSHVSG